MSDNITTQLDVGNVNETLNLLRSILSSNTLSESGRKELLVSYLPRIFPQSEYRSKLEAFASGAESYVRTAPSEASSSTRGFIDTLNGQMVLEFKKDLLNQRSFNEATLELKRYIAALWTQHGTNSSFGCLSTDVLNWRLYRPVPNTIPADGQYTADMVDLELTESLYIDQATESNAQHLTIFLKRVLLDENLLPLTADNIMRDFGLNSNLFGLVYPQLLHIIQESAANSEVELSLDLWKKQQDYNAVSESIINLDLYTKQVYLLILSRLMVANNFQESLPNDDRTIKTILNGEFFRNVAKLNNLVDYDFYGWITKDIWIDHFLPVARHLFHHIKMYDFSFAGNENMIQLIYDEMLPDEQRSALGQKSTPTNLAISVIDNLFEDTPENFRYLDPACGCGNFIRAALMKTREIYINEEITTDQLLRIITEAVTGIDIDPIAVILSKSVWAMTLSDLIRDTQQPVDIPIYHADSLFVARDESTQEQDDLIENPVIAFDNVRIEIPNALLRHSKEFDLLITWSNKRANQIAKSYERHGELRILEIDESNNILQNILSQPFLEGLTVEEMELLMNSTSSLVNELASRIIANRDGIWAFVLRNSYRPSLFAGQFDIIGTNPPWLTISNLPDVPYKDQLIRQASFFGIRPTGSSFLHSEIATTFALHNVKHFLKEEGKVAFIVSRSVTDGDNHAPFRTFNFRDKVPFNITEFWDLIDVPELFNLPSCVVFGRKQELTGTIHDNIPSRFFTNDLDNPTDGNIALCTLVDKNAWLRVDTDGYTVRGSDFYAPRFRQGADLMPRTALFVDLIADTPASYVVHVRTAATEIENRNNKKLTGVVFENYVNRNYIFSTVTSNTLLPFGILEDHLPKVILPVEIVDNTPRILSSEELIDRGDDTVSDWFEDIDSHDELRKSIYEMIDERGKLTQQSYLNYQYLVHCGAGGSKPCAAIQRGHIESPHHFIADQTTYVYGTDDEEEALYLIGIMNSNYVNEIIRPFQARGLFGERHIHKLVYKVIPPFNNENPLHQEVVRFTRALENRVSQLINNIAQLHDFSLTIQRRRSLLRSGLLAGNDNIESLNQAVESVLNENS
ncbi:Eco57I restriction-modification methylase domain-containing protein [Lysinibacillus sphaericus]